MAYNLVLLSIKVDSIIIYSPGPVPLEVVISVLFETPYACK